MRSKTLENDPHTMICARRSKTYRAPGSARRLGVPQEATRNDCEGLAWAESGSECMAVGCDGRFGRRVAIHAPETIAAVRENLVFNVLWTQREYDIPLVNMDQISRVSFVNDEKRCVTFTLGDDMTGTTLVGQMIFAGKTTECLPIVELPVMKGRVAH